MPPPLLLLLSTLVFGTGLAILLTQQHALFLLLGAELMLQAACFNFVLFGSYDQKHQGHVFALFVMVMVACETAVALALIFKADQRGELKKLTGAQAQQASLTVKSC